MHLLPTTRHIQTVKNNSVSPGAYIFSLDISLFSNKNWKDFLNNIFRSNLADNEIKSRFCSFKRCYMDGQIIWHRCDTNSPVIVKNPLFPCHYDSSDFICERIFMPMPIFFSKGQITICLTHFEAAIFVGY